MTAPEHTPLAPEHGTYAGYNWHVRYRVPTCAVCRAAATEYQRQHRSETGTRQERLQVKAYRQAEAALRERHRDEFDALYAAARKELGI